MPNIIAPLQGRPVVDITVDGQPLLQDSQVVFDSAIGDDTINTWNTWSLKLKAVTRAVYESVVVPLHLTSGRRVRLRWGIDTGTVTVWTAWEDWRVLRTVQQLTSSTASTAGVPFELTLVDRLYELDLVPRITARRGRASELAAQLAASHGLAAEVEPTAGAPLTLIQAGITDLQFLHRLRFLAASVSAAGYYLYLDGETLHFHTRDWKKVPQVLPYNTLVRTGASDLVAVDDAQENAVAAAGPATRWVVYDPLTGRTSVLTPDPGHYVRFGTRLSQAAGGSLVGAHAGPNQVSLEQARLQATYALARDRYERVSFALTNVLTVRAGSVVILQMTDASDSLSGPYHVEAVRLAIVGGSAQLTVTAARGELGGTPLDTAIIQEAGLAVEPTALPAAAPGANPRFLNEPEVQTLGTGLVTPVVSGT